MLEVIELMLKNRSNWEDILSNSPYNINIKYDTIFGKNMVMLKYDQLSSDFNSSIVRECRGLIIDIDKFEPISVPFFKFGNYGESYCPDIDWESAKILTKIDGSLIKIVRIGNELLISTNGTIDASKALIEGIGCPYNNYRELVLNAFPIKGLSYEYLVSLFDEGFTYMFELTSIYNKVVIPYEGIQLHLIGIRHNSTCEEIYIRNHPLSLMFPCPKEYGFKSLEECICAARELSYTEEGYVVVDKFFNRVKVKSPAYVEVHHLKGEGILTKKKCLSLIQSNELEEFLVYFPEYDDFAYSLKDKYEGLVNRLNLDWSKIKSFGPANVLRKDFASFVLNNCFCPAFMFGMYDSKYKDGNDYLKHISVDSVLNLIDRSV